MKKHKSNPLHNSRAKQIEEVTENLRVSKAALAYWQDTERMQREINAQLEIIAKAQAEIARLQEKLDLAPAKQAEYTKRIEQQSRELLKLINAPKINQLVDLATKIAQLQNGQE